MPGTTLERVEFLDMIHTLKPGEMLGQLPTMAELSQNLPPITWIWPGWLPRGMITLLGAAPGSGKSLLALDLANRIIQGTTFPDGQPVLHSGGPILYVDAEVATPIHHQRARDWEMDMSRLYMKLPERGGFIDLVNPAHRDCLVEEVAFNKPELVIIDALSNISSGGENDIEDVRLMLMFLNQLALDSQVGLLLIHHTRKSLGVRLRASEFTMDDIRDSGHIISMSRSVIGLFVVSPPDRPNPNGPRLVRVLKANNAPFPAPLGFELLSVEGNGVEMKWGPPPPAEFSTRPTAATFCKEWLEETLRQNGEMKPGEITQMAKEAGFSRSILYQAKSALGECILFSRPKHDPETSWRWREE